MLFFLLENLLNEILHCQPNDDKNIKIECFPDKHHLYDSAYPIRPIQGKHLRTDIALFIGFKIRLQNVLQNMEHLQKNY